MGVGIEEEKELRYFELVDSLQQHEVRLSDIVSLGATDKDGVKSKLDNDLAFRRVWNRNISGQFYTDMWEKLDNAVTFPRNELSRYYGAGGNGKSRCSLFIVYLQREFFDFDYMNFFSKMKAAVWLVEKSYEARKEGKYPSRFTINIDEDTTIFGPGSKQEETFFDGFLEFLRQAQINVHILNPNDISNINYQFECIGYDKEGFMKSVLYQKVDPRQQAWIPQGYILTKMPPKNYDDAYKLQKDAFLRSFTGNESGRNFKDEKILELVWNDMPIKTKQLIRSTILLKRERDTKFLITKGLQLFNLPVMYTRQLVDAFQWKYYEKELEQILNDQARMIQQRAEKSGFMKPLDSPLEPKHIAPLLPDSKVNKFMDINDLMNVRK